MTTKKLSWTIGLGILGLYTVLAIVFHNRLGPDFWPFDRSFVGPNLVASFALGAPAFAAGFITGRHEVKKIHAHNRWQASQTLKVHEHLGLKTDPHPHYNLASDPKVG